MADRANAYFNFGYYDTKKTQSTDEDHKFGAAWNDVPMQGINAMQRVLWKAHGELVALGEEMEAEKQKALGQGKPAKA